MVSKYWFHNSISTEIFNFLKKSSLLYLLEFCEYGIGIGDGVCHDENNKEACGYDDGDCCGPNVDTEQCTKCQCLDPDYQGKWSRKF